MATATKEAEGVADVRQRGDAQAAQPETGIDTGTLLGTLGGTFLIITAIIRGGDPEVFVNINGMLIVIGGTLATSFIAFPSKKILVMFPVIYNAYRPDNQTPADHVDSIMKLATKYRSGGMKQLENEEGKIDNPYLKNGIAMIVDGYNGREIHEILDRELTSLVERHNSGQKILRFMAVQAPVFGMAGTLIGLIQMLMHIDDPSTIGPALATALITTFYGIIVANLIITPIVAKLASKTDAESLTYKIIRVGVLGIHDRNNPQKIQRNMNTMLPPAIRK
ncbi:MAG: biopolymer transporter ExbB [Candidatus Nitrohelix vancouverensis]|uniref:Biopolymer transporter ExbB n=1 Tax=Candidatus Nitrohelix vancouverensis TaxID=2705534 RepID=A0A7T0G480_9BACT|nr:MAG: biopolymer transporter ExbB [Candidatus Nitrohelix vancouverensis]